MMASLSAFPSLLRQDCDAVAELVRIAPLLVADPSAHRDVLDPVAPDLELVRAFSWEFLVVATLSVSAGAVVAGDVERCDRPDGDRPAIRVAGEVGGLGDDQRQDSWVVRKDVVVDVERVAVAVGVPV